MDADLLQRLAIALGMGLLVGFQRQRVRAPLAGIRTFALISLIGAVSALLAERFEQPWVVGLALAGVAGLLAVGHFRHSPPGDADLTTEIAALLTCLVGAYAMSGTPSVAVTVAAVVALLLHFKEPLHERIHRLDEVEVRAVMTLVLVSLVVLPILPDRAYDPLGVLNPRQIWLMVVLIVAIGLAGYVAYKAFGETAGTLLSGVLGGLISSTATTVEQSRRAKESEGASGLASVVVIVASATTLLRILVELAAVSRPLLASTAAPLGIVFATLAVAGVGLHLVSRGERVPPGRHGNPAELKPALLFGALYAVVIVAVAASRHFFGNAGMTAVAAISGLTDVDAITLSTAQLVRDASLPADEGWRVVLIAALSNLVFKGGIVAVLGSRRLLVRVGLAFALALAAGVALLLWWPNDLTAWPVGP